MAADILADMRKIKKCSAVRELLAEVTYLVWTVQLLSQMTLKSLLVLLTIILAGVVLADMRCSQ